MAAEDELLTIAAQMKALELRFVDSGSFGLHLRSEDEATFKRLVVEAQSLMDSALGHLNNFSMNLVLTVNSGSGGFLGGPSLAAVQSARGLVEGSVNDIRRRTTVPKPSVSGISSPYVDISRLAALRNVSAVDWDLTRLVRLCEELNHAYSSQCHMSVAMLVRAITDHVPPIFGVRTFAEVANNYGGASSFKKSMGHLHQSLRNIADAHLHLTVRAKESLPGPAQVDFRQDLDVLLSEIERLLK